MYIRNAYLLSAFYPLKLKSFVVGVLDKGMVLVYIYDQMVILVI